MPSLPNWVVARTASAPVPGSTAIFSPTTTASASTYYAQTRDPNAPDNRLQISTRCIYERQLPGGSYITTHVERLQSGYYDSPVIHEDCITNVRFLALRFVFHEASTDRRFKSARIRLCIYDENRPRKGSIPLPPQIGHPSDNDPPQEPPRTKPRFMRHAPHLIYGSMSPETLDWNFNLAGSIGVSQAPVSATVNPSGGVKSSYKLYKMMKIQGSIRTLPSWHGQEYDVEDGELVWTMEENELQKSGLPREFVFVMMLTKGDDANKVRFDVDIEPEVASWFGHWPAWWVGLLKYAPLYKEPLNLDHDVGQRFLPCSSELGFNFAALMTTFDDFVSLPGTTYSTKDSPPVMGGPLGTGAAPATPTAGGGGGQKQQQQPPSRTITQSPAQIDGGDRATANNTLHLRIHLDSPRRHGHSMSANFSDSETGSKHQTTPSRSETGNRTSTAALAKAARRVTINGTLASTKPKYKAPRARPLSTHFEEQQQEQPSPSAKRTVGSVSSNEDEPAHTHESSLPEPVGSITAKSQSQLDASASNHRQNRSVSTTSSSTGVLPRPTTTSVSSGTGTGSNPGTSPGNAGAGASTARTPPTPASHEQQQHQSQHRRQHSLRRTRSRSGLRGSSTTSPTPPQRPPQHSSSEDEEAISAAMDMLSGSPPPPAPAPPASAPPAAMLRSLPNGENNDDVTATTPRTRAALADLLEVQQAENARVERRNGNLNTEMSNTQALVNNGNRARDRSADRVFAASRKQQQMEEQEENERRERMRQKRYSMPVSSTGIGYPGSTFTGVASTSGSGSSSGVTGFSPSGPFFPDPYDAALAAATRHIDSATNRTSSPLTTTTAMSSHRLNNSNGSYYYPPLSMPVLANSNAAASSNNASNERERERQRERPIGNGRSSLMIHVGPAAAAAAAAAATSSGAGGGADGRPRSAYTRQDQTSDY